MKKYIWFILVLLLINAGLVYAKEATYISCIDGDTIKVLVAGKEVTVRLLAVDSPEIEKQDTPGEYYSKEASDYTCSRIKAAKKIELEYDKNSDMYDKYNRLLAWVFLDGKLLQSDLVRLGYAKVAYLYGDYKYTDTLKEKQELASAKGLGIWKNNKVEEDNDKEEYMNKEVIILVIIFMLIAFLGDRILKRKK